MYLYALAAFRQPELLAQTLARTIDGEFRTQDAPFVARSLLLSVYGREAAWEFVKRNWETMERQYPKAGLRRLAEGVIGLATPELERDVHALLRGAAAAVRGQDARAIPGAAAHRGADARARIGRARDLPRAVRLRRACDGSLERRRSWRWPASSEVPRSRRGSTGTPGATEEGHRAAQACATEFEQVVGEGRGFGMAFAADQNGYPGPMHVLELKDRLRLTAEQEAKMRQLMHAMFAESKPKSTRLLEAEATLRRLFASQTADDAAVRAAVDAVDARGARYGWSISSRTSGRATS